MALKILIIDDHPLVSQGLAAIAASLAEEVQVESASGAQAGIDLAEKLQPDLILLDLHMPDMDGFSALSILSQNLANTSIVVVSGSEDAHDMQRAIASGAMGFIPKTASHSIMLNALNLIVAGGIYIPPEMLNTDKSPRVASAPTSEATPSTAPGECALTPRQIEVLHLLSQGKVNKEIARKLDCAETTVKSHITAIFRELKARNRTEAVFNAQRLGLLEQT